MPATEEQRLGTILWRGRWIIVLTLLATLAVVAVVTAITPKMYTSTAILQVGQGTVARNGNESTLSAQQAGEGLAKQYATLLTSGSFVERLRGPAGRSADDLKRQLTARAIPGTGLIELTLEGSSPDIANRLADRVATAFIATLQRDAERRSDRLQERAQTRIGALSTQLNALGTSGSAVVEARRAGLRSEQAALTEQLAGSVAQAITQGVSLAAPPSGSDSPTSPRPLLNLVAGIVLGLLLGIGLAYLRARIEPTLSSAEEAQQAAARVPVLASIPLRRRFSPTDPVLSEAYEMLRSAIVFRLAEDPERVITFASYSSGEGKTSTVQGLALAAQRSGKPLLVVDADLRTRELSSRFGHAASDGLTSVLTGANSLQNVIVEIAPGLSLLAAGPGSPNAPALLDSGAMRGLVEALRQHYPLILIDSPPASHLADAGILASYSDAVVVVARVDRTTRDDLQSAVMNLRPTGTPILGLVVLEHRAVDRKYFSAGSASSGTVPRTPVSHAG